MDFICQCIDTMLENGSDILLLMEGKPPVIRIEGNGKAIGSKRITETDLSAFMSGPMGYPEAAQNSVATEIFHYDGAGVPLKVKKTRTVGNFSLQITRVPTKELTRASEALTDPTQEQDMEAAEQESPETTQVEEVISSSAVGLADYFATMIKEEASDLHLSSGVPPYLRKDGAMIPLSEPPFTSEELHRVLMEIIPERNREEYEELSDTDFAYEIPGVARFRCNYFRDRKGCGAVFRQIPTEILTVDQLGLPEHLLKLCNLSKGLVLVTGPTGSGKSTTLAALVDHINKTRTDHIITIEDPIEFVHENHNCLINQREVNVHTKGFKQALRAALREDPDIVLIGELRDLETISIAIETAETGHLVFGTLHTTTAVSTVDRIIDQFPADRQGQIRVMLSESLRGVIAQTLCKKRGGGRVAALEVLLYSRAISNLIREGKTFQIPSAIQTGRKEGMMMLNDALIALVNDNLITAEEALMKSVDKDGIEPSLVGKMQKVGD